MFQRKTVQQLQAEQAEAQKKAAAKAEARRKALSGTGGSELHADAVSGILNYSRRFKKAGDSETSLELEKLHAQAVALLKDRTDAQAEDAKLKCDATAAAVAAAAGELLKKLPACFPTAEDAAEFAGKLPLFAARRSDVLTADRKRKLATQAGRANAELVRTIETAARLIGETDNLKGMSIFAKAGA